MTKHARPSIALVVLDTLRKDHFDRHFDWLPGRRYERAYSTSQWTVPAHASLFTGKYPREVGVHSKHLQFDCPESALAEMLADVGYSTFGFSANPNVSAHFNFNRGFDTFDSPLGLAHLNSDRVVDWGSFVKESSFSGFLMYIHGALHGSFKSLFGNYNTVDTIRSGFKRVLSDTYTKWGGAEEAIDWLEQQNISQPSFLFVNLMEAHEPYEAPDEYLSEDPPDLTKHIGDLPFDSDSDNSMPDNVRPAYDSCVRYLSDQYQEFFAKLSDSFDYVVTISDHGEMLGEHDAWGHEHGVYPELTHVPLVISGDGLSGSSKKVVSLVDIYVTILELAGIDQNHTIRGRSLFDGTSGRDALTEYTGLTPWREGLLQESDYSDSVLEKYDEKLYGVAAPNGSYVYQTVEGINVIGEEIDDPEERIQRIVRDLDTRDVEAQDDDIPDDVRQQLKDLGYA